MDANYLIDIHSSSNKCIDYLFSFPGTQQENAAYFKLNYGVLMDTFNGNSFDEAFLKPWLALQKEFKRLGKEIEIDRESWTLELGSGMEMEPKSVSVGFSGIKNYLVQKEILKLYDYSLNKTKIELVPREKIKNYYAPTGGMIQNRLSLKTQVKEGDRLYQIISFNKHGNLPEVINITAEKDGFIFDLSTNFSVNQGEYVLSIFSLN